MGFYARPLRWLKVTHTKRRGWRVAIGPRILRRWYGKPGEGGWSTGAGPFSHYFPDRRRQQQVPPRTGQQRRRTDPGYQQGRSQQGRRQP